MTNKIKVFVSFLALIAMFSVLSFFNSFKNSSSTFLKPLTGSILEAIDQDVDKDGLTNREESYWNTDFQNPDTDRDGFLDGEEVASGHDPLIPGSDDFLPTDANLTQKLSSLTLAGLYEGSLKSDSPNYDKSLNALADIIADDAKKNMGVDLSNIKLKTINSDKNSQELYLRAFSPIFEEFSIVYVSEIKNLTKNLEIIDSSGFGNKNLLAEFSISNTQYSKTFNDLLRINVPNNWKQNHLVFVRLVGNLIQINQAIHLGEDDPIKATAALTRLVSLWETFPDLVEAYVEKIKTEELSTVDTVF